MPAPKGNQYAKGCTTNGRPTKYKEEYCELLVSHLAEGLSYFSFAGLVGVTKDCLYKWEKEHKDFLYHKKMGKAKEELFLERIGRAGMSGKIKGFNPATYIFTRKNKSGWSDKVESNVEIKDINVNIKEWTKE